MVSIDFVSDSQQMKLYDYVEKWRYLYFAPQITHTFILKRIKKNFHPLILNILKVYAATSTKKSEHKYSFIPDYVRIPNLKSFNQIGQE